MTLNRRLFAQTLGSLGFLGYCLKDQNLLEAAPCPQEDIKESESTIGLGDDEVFSWIDCLGSLSRAHLAIFLKIPQTPSRYVERVVLATSEKKTLAARYLNYPPLAKPAPYPPYAIFSPVDLRYSRRYFLLVRLRENGSTKIYRYTFDADRLVPSSLAGAHLPRELQVEFAKSHQGRVITPLRFPVKLLRPAYAEKLGLDKDVCFARHFPQARLKQLGSGNLFTMAVDYGYPDLDSENYLRYFILTDPVGRLISLIKRDFGDNTPVILSALGNTVWQKRWGLSQDHIATLRSCPYVRLFAEHKKDGLYQTNLQLH